MTGGAAHADVVLAMPVHNSAPYLPEALQTILAQAGPPVAIVALDDCSTDVSPAILKAVAREDERLLVQFSDERMGSAGRERVLPRYAVDRLVDDVDRLYKSLLARTDPLAFPR